MGVCLTVEEFERDITTRFQEICSKRAYTIVARSDQNREFKSDGLPLSEGGRIESGDIAIYPPRDDRRGISIFIGAKFDTGNPVESVLRKSAYDKIFAYPGAHRLQVWHPGRWGSPFDENTPYIEITLEHPSVEREFKETYQRAREYLATIDSAEFKALVNASQEAISKSLDEVIRLASLKINFEKN